MREMLAPTSAIIAAGLGDSVGLITDGRFSGGTYAWWWDTSCPRQRSAVLSGWSKRGTIITIDAHARLLHLNVADEELKRRRQRWTPPAPRYTRGVRAKHAPGFEQQSGRGYRWGFLIEPIVAFPIASGYHKPRQP